MFTKHAGKDKMGPKPMPQQGPQKPAVNQPVKPQDGGKRKEEPKDPKKK